MEYKEFAKYYDIFYKNKNYVKETEFLKKFINQDDKIIDIGCGTGLDASLLQQNGFKVDGLDLNKEMLNSKGINVKEDDFLHAIFAYINALQDISAQFIDKIADIINTSKM